MNELILIESKSARQDALRKVSHDTAQTVLEKAKAIVFAAWQETGIATTEQMAEFYEVPSETVLSVLKNHRDEFELDGLKVLRGKQLKDASSVIDEALLSEKISQLTAWTPRAGLRLGMLLTKSEVAKEVRTLILNMVSAVLAQSEKIRELELQVQFALAQKEAALANSEVIQATKQLQESSQWIIQAYGEHRLAMLRGQAPVVERIEEKVFVDYTTGELQGSSKSRCSLSALLRAAGFDEKAIASTKLQKAAKSLLAEELKINLDSGEGTEQAAYIRQYKVIPESKRLDAIRVLKEQLTPEVGLFEYQNQTAASKIVKN